MATVSNKPAKQFTQAEVEQIVLFAHGNSATIVAEQFGTSKAVILGILKPWRRPDGTLNTPVREGK